MTKKCKLLIAIFLFVLIVFLGFLYINGKNKDIKSMQLISLDEFQTFLQLDTIEEQLFVYIGRDSCPTCNVVYPTLCEIMIKYNINMLYYSTESDRTLRSEEMSLFLKSINVYEVPAIVAIENGKIIQIYDGEEFVKYYI